ncbi:hypothetical protein CRM22_006981 [Opisthorchis felineus]|uniref:Attacin C-terminal domain-containing protein n=1 Tax=Opisthorchis felineus TaxID=147828 RepID=A0A4S2LI94_OPIFE|nr:hypothetical protein CRM22_006981 [Opisthorchis felineus]
MMNNTWLFLLVTCLFKLSSPVPINLSGSKQPGSKHHGFDGLENAGTEHHGSGHLGNAGTKNHGSMHHGLSGSKDTDAKHFGFDNSKSAGTEHHGLGISKPSSRTLSGQFSLDYEVRNVNEYGATYKWTPKPHQSSFDDLKNAGTSHHGLSGSTHTGAKHPAFGDLENAGSEHHGDLGFAGSSHRGHHVKKRMFLSMIQ